MRTLSCMCLLLFVMGCKCFVNLVYDQGLRGTATMSARPFNHLGASYAIDGDTGEKQPCTVMDVSEGYESVWWKVWLPKIYNIAEIKIYFRPNTKQWSTGFSIYAYGNQSYIPPSNVFGSLVYKHDPTTGCPSNTMTIQVNKVTQGIAFYNTKDGALHSTCNASSPYKVIEICEVNVMGCDVTRYSEDCSRICDGRCLHQHCDAYNGKCKYGCTFPHRTGPHCTECVDKHYSSDCSKLCGHCKNGEGCNDITGHCVYGCQPNWQEPLCQVCKDNFHGQACESCGHCKAGTVCNKETGECPDGCQDHWTGSTCDVCEDGFYGPECSEPCGYCTTGTICDKVTGICPNECQDHWGGPKCNECVDKHYSSDCSKLCGHCKNGEGCNDITGHCVYGCQPNWQEPLCQVCKDNFHGQACEPCGHCKTGTLCNRETGKCPDGCQYHWTGSTCDVCEDGFYGPGCSEPCGYCTRGTFCDNVTGICPNGCEDHWGGPKCNGFLNVAESDKSPAIGLYVAIGVLALLFAVSVGFNAKLKHRLWKQGKDHLSQPHENQTKGYVNVKEKEEIHLGARHAPLYPDLTKQYL